MMDQITHDKADAAPCNELALRSVDESNAPPRPPKRSSGVYMMLFCIFILAIASMGFCVGIIVADRLMYQILPYGVKESELMKLKALETEADLLSAECSSLEQAKAALTRDLDDITTKLQARSASRD